LFPRIALSIPAIKYLRPETKTKMLTLNRPRRSVLYMPASNPRVLEKAKGLAADTLIFDLEDAVAPDAKSAARDAAVAAVASNDYGHRECLIRVNALDTQWGEDDLKAAASSKTDGVIIPKVSAPDEMAQVDEVLTRCGAADDFPLWAMMETARGVWAANDIARSSNRLVGFCAGTADLAKDLHCTHPADRAPMLTALQLIVLAARVNGFAVLDGVHVDLNDEAGSPWYAARDVILVLTVRHSFIPSRLLWPMKPLRPQPMTLCTPNVLLKRTEQHKPRGPR